MKDALIISALSVVPKNHAARLMGVFARTRLPAAAQRALLRWYVGKYRVDLEECVGTLEDYGSLTDFFTRALKPGVRPVDPAPRAIVSPCDGMAYAVGRIEGGRIPQSDGKSYDVRELLGGDPRYSALYGDGGDFAVLYLSPRDYHRVHVPREGTVARYSYLPGALWPVFPAATRRIEALFARNERLTSWIVSDLGEYALVMVGAFGVGRMRVVYDPLVTNEGKARAEVALTPPAKLERGDEIGRFEMGSTVILVFPPNTVEWTITPGDPVRVGSRVGQWRQN
ncbi:MAG: archaetidylserine decarboxylase [Pseudomonadota bacterium]|nr:archaetidylserine decarboxylase [Pseudomonadota bacterium]